MCETALGCPRGGGFGGAGGLSGTCVCWEVVTASRASLACPVLGDVTSVDCAEPLLFGAGWSWPVGHGQGPVCVAERLCVS